MAKLKILFYNNAHIGDIHFSQPYVKNIIDSNGDNFDYYIYCECNYFIFTNLFPNIKKIKEHPEIYNIMQSYDFHPGEKLYYYDRNNNILLLGTWYANFTRLSGVSCPINCDLLAYFDFYNLVIQRLNAEYDMCVNFTPFQISQSATPSTLLYASEAGSLNEKICNISSKPIIPEFPKIDIQKFLDYKKIQNYKNKQIVFYYNVLAASSQRFPVNNHEEHLQIIKELLTKDIILFLPYKIDSIIHYIRENNITNIIFVDDMFNLTFDEDCENIYYYIKISQYCDISFYFDTGRCFLYVNNEFIENNNNILDVKRYHFANNPYYYNTFNKYFEKSYSEYICSNNYTDIIHFVQTNI